MTTRRTGHRSCSPVAAHTLSPVHNQSMHNTSLIPWGIGNEREREWDRRRMSGDYMTNTEKGREREDSRNRDRVKRGFGWGWWVGRGGGVVQTDRENATFH